jgi:hypothetical protein
MTHKKRLEKLERVTAHRRYVCVVDTPENRTAVDEWLAGPRSQPLTLGGTIVGPRDIVLFLSPQEMAV